MNHAGRWGAVCNDRFGPPEAAVACRELGFSPEGAQVLALPVSPAANASGLPVLLDEVQCSVSWAALDVPLTSLHKLVKAMGARPQSRSS